MENWKPFLIWGALWFTCLGVELVGNHLLKKSIPLMLMSKGVLVFLRLIIDVEMTLLALKVVRGRPNRLKAKFKSWSAYGRYFGVMVLSGVASLLGLVMLVVPGIVVAAGFAFAYLVVLEYKIPITSALVVSWELTRGVRIKTLGLALLSILMAVLGILVVGVGLMVANPVITIMWVVAYRELERQTKLPKLELLKAKV